MRIPARLRRRESPGRPRLTPLRAVVETCVPHPCVGLHGALDTGCVIQTLQSPQPQTHQGEVPMYAIVNINGIQTRVTPDEVLECGAL